MLVCPRADIDVVQVLLGPELYAAAGAQHMLNADYFKRIDALNFSMINDDGQSPENLEHADIVLLGVSRTSKTPTSIYLANRGYKTATFPLFRACHCQKQSTISAAHWLSASLLRLTALCRSGKTGFCRSMPIRRPIMSTVLPLRRRSQHRAGCSLSGAGRPST